MRLGVLDVGSNTVHLVVVDAFRGGHPRPAHSEKTVLRLAEQIGPDGRLDPAAASALVAAVAQMAAAAHRHGVEDLLAFATSAVRDATNSSEVLQRVREETGIELRVLSGEDEARMTFLAVRRWFGWSTGRLLNLDIGGGSLEIASGGDEEPDIALSLPLGAARPTRGFLAEAGEADRPAPAAAVRQLTDYVESVLDPVVGKLVDAGWDRPVATSKTFRTLARLADPAPSGGGLYRPRRLSATGLRRVLGFIRLIPMGAAAELEGVSPGRGHQLLAGAVVAEATMRRLGVDELDICPWALREGVLLRRCDSPD